MQNDIIFYNKTYIEKVLVTLFFFHFYIHIKLKRDYVFRRAFEYVCFICAVWDYVTGNSKIG